MDWVDLDGTLAKSAKAQTGEEIGAPIRPMVQLVKWWLARGDTVRILVRIADMESCR